MATPLEIASALKRTEEGNNDHYYGGGDTAYTSTALAYAGVPQAVRKGRTVGIWENGKVVEYMWHTDTSNAGLIKKTVDVDLTDYQRKPEGLISYGAMYRFVGGQVRIVNPVWRLNGVSHTTGNTNDDFFVPLITNSNARRIDILCGNEVNQLSVVSGVQDLTNPLFPAVPAGKIMLASIHVDGDTISSFRPYSTSAAVLGNDNSFTGSNLFVGPVEFKQSITVESFAGKNVNFERYGYANRIQVNVSGNITLGLYLVTNTLIELNATAAGVISQLENPYVGATYELANTGVANITIKNNASIKIPNGQDLVLKPGYSARFQSSGAVCRLVNDGMSASQENFTTAQKNKLDSILKGIDLSFNSPTRECKVYFKTAAIISQIVLDGAISFQYSLNGGQSYPTPTLPLTPSTKINIPAGTWVRFRVTFTNNTTIAGVSIELE